jgi:TonB family protein
MFAILASLLLHGVFILAMMATTWFWGRSGFERLSTYTVSLVDAPLSLTQPPAPVVPPLTVAPPKDRDKAPVSAPKPPTEKEKVEKAAKPESRPSKKGGQPKPKPPPPAKPAIATSTEALSAIDRLRQQQARQEEQRQQAVLAQKRAVAERIESLREQLVRTTNAGDQADAMAGLQRVRFAAYQERVRTRIIQAWVLPLPPEQSQTLQATVFFRVRRDGRVDGLDLVQSSGNALFDASLVRAIHRASPLPELPADYPKDLLEVEMRFSAREPSAG